MLRRAAIFRFVAFALSGACLWFCVDTAWAHSTWARGATDPVGEWVLTDVEVLHEGNPFLRRLHEELREEHDVARITLHTGGHYVASGGMAGEHALADWAVRATGTSRRRVPAGENPEEPGAGLLTWDDVRHVAEPVPEVGLATHTWRREGSSFAIEFKSGPYATATLWGPDDLREVVPLDARMWGAAETEIRYRWRRVR